MRRPGISRPQAKGGTETMPHYSRRDRESSAARGERPAGDLSTQTAPESLPAPADIRMDTRAGWLRSIRGEALRVGGLRRPRVG